MSLRALRPGVGRRWPVLAFAFPLLGVSWALMWSVTLYWNPFFFMSTWVGVTLLMYSFGPRGYPGLRVHAALAVVSMPVWWWFELANARVENWEYVTAYDYGVYPYTILASLAFSTVVPALHAAWGMTTGWLGAAGPSITHGGRGSFLLEVMAGLAATVLVFAAPDVFFPLVWVGPFLTFDGIVGYQGGHDLIRDIYVGEWRLAVAVGLAGLICGILWEFWNFWSMPKWIYHVQYLDYIHVFEMPILGYLGYIPFAWSVYQLVHVKPVRGFLERSSRAVQRFAQE